MALASGRLHRNRPADAVFIHRLRVGGPAMILGVDLLADAVVHIDHDSGAEALDPAQGGRDSGGVGARRRCG